MSGPADGRDRAMGAISATTLARSRCCPSFPAALVRCCPYIFDVREQVFPQIGAPLCWVVPVDRHVPGVPAFRQRVKT
jgi:hypothetical protein